MTRLHSRQSTSICAIVGSRLCAGRHENLERDRSFAELVGFRELNLFGNWPMRRRFQVIFCRNVVIYFDDRTQKSVWNRFVPVLAPGGRLYIGHSERICGDAAAAFETEGITTYKLREGSLS